MQENTKNKELSNSDTKLHSDLVSKIINHLDSGEHENLKFILKKMHPADLADILSFVQTEDRKTIIDLLGHDFNPEILSEIDESIRDEIIEILPSEFVSKAISKLETDDAVHVLEDLQDSKKRIILETVPKKERVEEGLNYPEDSAGRRMQHEFVAIPSFWNVGQTIDHLRETRDLPIDFLEVFIVDVNFHPIGTVPVSKILRTPRSNLMKNIMKESKILVTANMDQEEVGYIFEQYGLVSAGVVDSTSRLVGMITADDIVWVMKEEAEEDIYRLGGVGEESLSGSIIDSTKKRFVWLFLNLGTAIIASLVIGLFDGTIEEMVALAILMPIVASMGGNAGTQTLTVTVRAIATRELLNVNASRIITKEFLIGILNGCLFAVIVGFVAFVWFSNVTLSLVIGGAMVINMIVAALSGIIIPIILNKMKFDPALASSVFVTTVTDVIGFFSFLGLASWFLF